MNILWITTDHQQWRTIANRSPCRMPSLQRLADTGLLFNRSYSPMPVCCPVRAMWMTGAYPWHNGVFTQVHSAPGLTRDLFPEAVTYSQHLRQAGYRQGFVGKWHVSRTRTPLDFGFDEIAVPVGYSASSLAQLSNGLVSTPAMVENLRVVSLRHFSWPGSEPFLMWGCLDGPVQALNTTRIADAAIEMLGRFSHQAQPWHIAVHFPEPHDPYLPHRQYLDRYDPAKMPVPRSFWDTFDKKPDMHRREAGIWGNIDENDVKQGTACFFAYCEQVDEQIGRVLDALEQSGQADRTIVAFNSDHGDMLGAHRMWIKSWMPYDEVYRIPMILRVPGMTPPGRITDQLVQTHDLPHTFLDLVGAKPLPFTDGRSLRPLMQLPDCADWRDAILCVSYGGEFIVIQRMVITGQFKYVFNGFDFDEMYCLQSDPDEMNNLVEDAGFTGQRAALRTRLYALMNQFGDPFGDVGSVIHSADPPNRYGAPRYLPRI